MRVLVTNDDGIYAPGLWALAEEMLKVGEVLVAAPDREQSAVGTSVTLHQPLRINKVKPAVQGVEAYSIEGTPADSVIMALGVLLRGNPDLLVSGINEGANLGNDVFISGTVGAALQGYFYNIPSLAISMAAFENHRFDVAAKLAGMLVRRFSAEAPPARLLLNINLPNVSLSQIRGIELTKLGERTYLDQIKEGHDGKRHYYWIVRGEPNWADKEGTDIWALRRNRISVTPLGMQLSRSGLISLLRELCHSLFDELHASGL